MASSIPSGASGGGSAATQTKQNRFVDFQILNSGVAGPIKGLFDDAKNPRVSIQVAVAHMAKHLDDDLKSELDTSKLHCGQSTEVLALMKQTRMRLDHAQVIYLYTVESPLYRKLNDALRSKDRGVLKAHFFPFLRILIAAIPS